MELKLWLEHLMEMGKEIQDLSDSGKNQMLPSLLGYIETAKGFLPEIEAKLGVTNLKIKK